MRLLFYSLAVLLTFVAVVLAEENAETALPTWQDEMAKGIVPYHQLTVDDFQINDAAQTKGNFDIRTAVEPCYHFMIKPYKGFQFAYIDQWMVFSGLNKKETWRRSGFKGMKASLPFAQAILDLNEIYARQLAALKLGELPQVRANTFEEAKVEMNRRMKEFVEAKYKAGNAELEAFAKATANGAKDKKVRELGAEIKKRLEATPFATVPFPEATAAPSPPLLTTPAQTIDPLKWPPPAPKTVP